MLTLRYTILYVDDVAATLAFYERAFGLTRGMLHESGDYGELATGETKLSFSSVALMKQLGKNPGRAQVNAPVFEIAFECDDVASAYQQALDAGASSVQAPREESWGQTTSYVEDPNGFLVEICSPVRASAE